MPGNFEFKGFEPNSDLKTFSKEIFWLVEEKAPSQSAKTATLVKSDDGFTAKIKVSSSSGVFEVEAKNLDAKSCIEDVYLQMKSVLKTWAHNRMPSFIEDADEIA